MKHMHKLLSVIVVLALAMSLAVPAFAANDGKITVNNAVTGQTYSIYQIASLESFSGTNYAYKLNDEWKDFVDNSGSTPYTFSFEYQAAGATKPDTFAGSIYELLIYDVTTGYVTWTTESVEAWHSAEAYAAFAKEAKAYAAEKGLTSVSKVASGNTVVFDNLPLGWYLMDSSLGVLCSLNTTDTEVTIEEKNAAPTITKQIADSEGGPWDDADEVTDRETFQIGDTVYYRVDITLQPNLTSAVVTDTMGAGLTWAGIENIGYDDDAAGEHVDLVEETDYTMYVYDPGKEETPYTFSIAFKDTFLNSITTERVVSIYYTATLNQNADIYGEESTGANDNTVKLTYKAEAGETEITDKTEAKTFEVPVFKYTGSDEPLSGATFTLSKNADGSNPIFEVTTDDTGKFTIEGLDAGIYYLNETEAPNGYNKLAAPIAITITYVYDEATDTETVTVDPMVDGFVKVENKTGSELPSTGGIGTTIFYIVGGLMAVGAAVLLITKRRMTVGE